MEKDPALLCLLFVSPKPLSSFLTTFETFTCAKLWQESSPELIQPLPGINPLLVTADSHTFS